MATEIVEKKETGTVEYEANGETVKLSPNMIKKIIVEEKTRDEEGYSFIDKIREQYMRIGIGDD